jgi:hypothetical protein
MSDETNGVETEATEAQEEECGLKGVLEDMFNPPSEEEIKRRLAFSRKKAVQELAMDMYKTRAHVLGTKDNMRYMAEQCLIAAEVMLAECERRLKGVLDDFKTPEEAPSD